MSRFMQESRAFISPMNIRPYRYYTSITGGASTMRKLIVKNSRYLF